MILAGGQSLRMGFDKARMRLGRRSLLGWVRRAAAAGLKWPVRVIRRDALPSCGPLSGLATGCMRARTEWVLYLACDMPLVHPESLRRIVVRGLKASRAAAAEACGRVGFPVLLPRSSLATILARIEAGHLSMGGLLDQLGAQRVKVTGLHLQRMINVNTPADWERARAMVKALEKVGPGACTAGACSSLNPLRKVSVSKSQRRRKM